MTERITNGYLNGLVQQINKKTNLHFFIKPEFAGLDLEHITNGGGGVTNFRRLLSKREMAYALEAIRFVLECLDRKHELRAAYTVFTEAHRKRREKILTRQSRSD